MNKEDKKINLNDYRYLIKIGKCPECNKIKSVKKIDEKTYQCKKCKRKWQFVKGSPKEIN